MSRTVFYCRCGARLEGASERFGHRCPVFVEAVKEAARIAGGNPDQIHITPNREMNDGPTYTKKAAKARRDARAGASMRDRAMRDNPEFNAYRAGWLDAVCNTDVAAIADLGTERLGALADQHAREYTEALAQSSGVAPSSERSGTPQQ